jgi:hypothetical protein
MPKPINIGSTFEDLDARISNVKTVRNLVLEIFHFKKMNLENKGKNAAPLPSLSSLIPTLFLLATCGEQGNHYLGIFWHHGAPFVARGAMFSVREGRPF